MDNKKAIWKQIAFLLCSGYRPDSYRGLTNHKDQFQ